MLLSFWLPRSNWKPGSDAPRERNFGRLLHGQVAHQPLEALAIGVVVLPAGEIANVALIAQLARPRLSGLQHHIIQPRWKYDRLFAVSLLGKCLVDLILDP